MEISVGAILEGTIKSITKFGAFVTLPGGRSGLVHISEIAHSYVENVSDFLSEGQTVKVKVVNIPRASAGTGRTAPPTSGAVTAAAPPPRVAAATTTAAGSPPATVPVAATTATTPAPLPPKPQAPPTSRLA